MPASPWSFYALSVGLLVATAATRHLGHQRPSFYALSVGLLVATLATPVATAVTPVGFYALSVGLLVATDPGTDGR